jgi:hypothetical protein
MKGRSSRHLLWVVVLHKSDNTWMWKIQDRCGGIANTLIIKYPDTL